MGKESGWQRSKPIRVWQLHLQRWASGTQLPAKTIGLKSQKPPHLLPKIKSVLAENSLWNCKWQALGRMNHFFQDFACLDTLFPWHSRSARQFWPSHSVIMRGEICASLLAQKPVMLWFKWDWCIIFSLWEGLAWVLHFHCIIFPPTFNVFQIIYLKSFSFFISNEYLL